ncbi:hypothetical protein [Methylorubrum aminovorans]
MTIRVTRGPVTTGDRYLNEYDVRLEPEPGIHVSPVEAVALKFMMNAGGGGQTVVHVRIEAESFRLIAQAMMNVDPEAAVKAFGAAMVAGCQCGVDPDFWA